MIWEGLSRERKEGEEKEQDLVGRRGRARLFLFEKLIKARKGIRNSVHFQDFKDLVDIYQRQMSKEKESVNKSLKRKRKEKESSSSSS